MRSVNLIPAPRRDARQRWWRVRWWCVGVTVWGGVLLLAYLAARTAWQVDEAALERELALVRQEVEHAERSLGELRPRLAEAGAALEVSQAVAKQPDWSVLLALLATLRGEDVVLDHCDLRAAPAPAGPAEATKAALPAEGQPQRVVLRVGGYGRSQPAVARFVLALEQSGMFDRVGLLKCKTEAVMGTDATVFQVECLLHGTRRAPR